MPTLKNNRKVTSGKSNSDSKSIAGVFHLRHLFYLLVAGLFALALISHDIADLALIQHGIENGEYRNWIGDWGAHVAWYCFFLFGLSSYFAAAVLLLAAFRPLLPLELHRRWFWPGFFAVLAGSMVLFALDPVEWGSLCNRLGLGRVGLEPLGLSGGVIGQVLAAPPFGDFPPGILRHSIGLVGCTLIAMGVLLLGLIMLYRSEWHSVLMGMFQAWKKSRDAGSVADNVEEDVEDEEPERIGSLIPKMNFMERLRQSLQRHDAERVPEAVAEAVADTSAEPEALVPVASSSSLAPERKPEAPLPIVERPVVMAEPIEDKKMEPIPDQQYVAAAAAAVPADSSARTAMVSEPAGTPPGASSAPAPTLAGELRPAQIVDKGSQAPRVRSQYTLPPCSMLRKGREISGESAEVIAHNKEILSDTLFNFKVDGEVCGHISGPRVTRYEIRLAPNVKVNKITEIERNIKMNLSAASLRLLAPIPGRDVVGVEVPNRTAEAIQMRSVMESDAWINSRSEIPIVLGKGISGNPVVLDLAKAPHLLIAGSTGSGKSVCMNSLIMSLLMKFSPDDLKLIMVDPKVVEMAAYEKLPHLITPVMNDAKKVPFALRWACNEMDKRYMILAQARVKKLSEFNSRTLPPTPQLDKFGQPLPDRMPILIVIIDELADLMCTDARKEVETSIARIAAKGRAAGVHIVVATQRPSRDVITGTIKSNLPTRISFRVISNIDSRVILDQSGAEALLGKGDMLLLAPNATGVERIQGSMVDDEDIEKVVAFISDQVPQEFDNRVTLDPDAEEEENGEAGELSGDWNEEDADAFIDNGFAEGDPRIQRFLEPGDPALLRQVLEMILREKRVSTSSIQRRFGIGYNSAAKMIDLLEERGVIGPPSGSGKAREILILDELLNEE